MYLVAAFFLLGLFIIWGVSLAYRWLIAEQRNQTYGTIMIPGKQVAQVGKVEKFWEALKDAACRITQPVNWSAMAPRLVRIDEPTQSVDQRSSK